MTHSIGHGANHWDNLLPSALLQAGYVGVAASLWTVADISTAMLMAYFYKLWRADGVAPPELRQHQRRWRRDSTNREKQAFFAGYVPELVNQLKMGATVAVEFFIKANLAGGADERTFAHPYWWAAFGYTGV
jgi:CHAT domain-containing protein